MKTTSAQPHSRIHKSMARFLTSTVKKFNRISTKSRWMIFGLIILVALFFLLTYMLSDLRGQLSNFQQPSDGFLNESVDEGSSLNRFLHLFYWFIISAAPFLLAIIAGKLIKRKRKNDRINDAIRESRKYESQLEAMANETSKNLAEINKELPEMEKDYNELTLDILDKRRNIENEFLRDRTNRIRFYQKAVAFLIHEKKILDKIAFRLQHPTLWMKLKKRFQAKILEKFHIQDPQLN